MEELGPSRPRAEEQAEVEESMSDIEVNILAFVYFVAVMQSCFTSL